jgi:hypothetical protein
MTEVTEEHWEGLDAALRGLQLLVKDVANYDYEFLEAMFDDTTRGRAKGDGPAAVEIPCGVQRT